MDLYLAIDDTDNLESPGSGQLAERLATALQAENLVSQHSQVSRHQLFVHESIAYTSHNSAMCFSAKTGKGTRADIIRFATEFLQQESAAGSDPGLCVAQGTEQRLAQLLMAFGYAAKRKVMSKAAAYQTAERAGVHLSEHGGTGDGVVGALAGLGLRLTGNDGRLRGWLQLGEVGEILRVEEIVAHPQIDLVTDQVGGVLPTDSEVLLCSGSLKTILKHHLRMLPVKAAEHGDHRLWTSLEKQEMKKY